MGPLITNIITNFQWFWGERNSRSNFTAEHQTNYMLKIKHSVEHLVWWTSNHSWSAPGNAQNKHHPFCFSTHLQVCIGIGPKIKNYHKTNVLLFWTNSTKQSYYWSVAKTTLFPQSVKSSIHISKSTYFYCNALISLCKTLYPQKPNLQEVFYVFRF